VSLETEVLGVGAGGDGHWYLVLMQMRHQLNSSFDRFRRRVSQYVEYLHHHQQQRHISSSPSSSSPSFTIIHDISQIVLSAVLLWFLSSFFFFFVSQSKKETKPGIALQ